MTFPDPTPRLCIIRKQRQIGGVFDAFGRRFGVSPWLLRVPAAALLAAGMAMPVLGLLRLPLIIAYIVLYFVLPKVSVDHPKRPSLLGQLATVALLLGPYAGLLSSGNFFAHLPNAPAIASAPWLQPFASSIVVLDDATGQKYVTVPSHDPVCPAGQEGTDMVVAWKAPVPAADRGAVAGAVTKALAAGGFTRADKSLAPEPASMYLTGPDGVWVTLVAGDADTTLHLFAPCAPTP